MTFLASLSLSLALLGGESVPDFALVDQAGVFHQLSRYAEREAVVLFIQGNGCPIVRHSAPALRELRETYAPKGVEFLLLNPQTQDDAASIRVEAEKYELADFPILIDSSQLVAESLGIERTAEALVIDPAAMELLYRGPIDDRLDYESQKNTPEHTYLADALDAVLEGRPVESLDLRAPGCALFFAARDDHARDPVSFNADIVPILAQRCVRCHTEGGLAPWAMNSHKRVRGWSQMIREVVMTQRMPPGQVDPEFEHLFADVNALPDDELQALVHWIDAGAPPDPDSDADGLAELKGLSDEWELGEPDLCLALPPQPVPATGLLEYRRVEVDVGNTEDLWVRALEFRPSDREVLHHLLSYIQGPADPPAIAGPKAKLLGGYGPGKSAQVLPAGTGRFLPAHSRIVVSLHYTTSGRATLDQTVIGLYLHEEPPARALKTKQASTRRFAIPPGSPAYTVTARTRPFEQAIHIHSFTPHMHLRGKSMRYYASSRGAERELLMSVPNFSFNWQLKYTLREPILLEAGQFVIAEGEFDNSVVNPLNPDPSQEVTYGTASWDEMFIGYFNYSEVDVAAPPAAEDEGEGY